MTVTHAMYKLLFVRDGATKERQLSIGFRLSPCGVTEPRRLVLLVTVIASSILFGGCTSDERKPVAELVNNQTRTPASRTLPQTSLPMPPINSDAESVGWTLLDGRLIRLRDYRGQVVVLDFYATWCPPCRDEVPHLASLQTRFGGEGLQVIGLNVGGEEDRPKIPDFVKELGINYQLATPTPEAVDLFMGGDSSIPQTLIFNRNGELLRHFSGYDATTRRELETAIADAVRKEVISDE